MTIYTVKHTIQSLDTSNEPVEIRWYRGSSLGQALSALVTAAVERDDATHLPESARYRVLSATITHEEDAPTYEDNAPDRGEEVREAMREDAETDGWDFETDASLDECLYWSQPEAECAGPRVGVRRADSLTLCERHFNEPPR
jgi:hypothetical protein